MRTWRSGVALFGAGRRWCALAAGVVAAAVGVAAGQTVTLNATSVPIVDGWNFESRAEGPVPGSCAGGQNCRNLPDNPCSASAPSGEPTTVLRATQFDNWSRPLGHSIDDVSVAFYGRYANGVAGNAVIDLGGTLGDNRTFSIGSTCDWQGNWNITGLLGRPWTKSDVDALTVGVRRTSTNTPTEELLATAFRVRVVTSCAPIVVTQNPQSARVCAGQVVTLAAAAAGIDTLSYQWYFNGQPIASATTPSHPDTRAGSYFCRITSQCNRVLDTSVAEISYYLPPSISPQPSNARICQGQTHRFSLGASGDRPLSYQWFYNDAPVPGAVGSAHDDTRAGTYFCRVSLDCGTFTDSERVTLSYYNPPSISPQPSNARICQGQTHRFSLGASGERPLAYQWFYNDAPVPGAVGSAHDDTRAGTYFCRVSLDCGTSTDSARVTLSFYNPPSISPQPSNARICEGQTHRFTLGASGDRPLSYQWFYNDAPVPGAVGSAHDDTRVGTYFCRVSLDCGTSTDSARVTLSFYNPPSISPQPSNARICQGQTHRFSLGASGDRPLSYQWFYNDAPVPGAVGSAHDDTRVGTYFCRVRLDCGTFTDSTRVTLAVDSPPTAIISPSSLDRCVGTSATFTVAATGTAPLSYQWRKNTVNIPGATSSSYTIPSVVVGDAGNYDCIVTNPCGNTTSNPAPLNVIAQPQITQQPIDQPYCEGVPGATVQFCVQSPTPGVTYQWYRQCGPTLTPIPGGPCTTAFVPSAADTACTFFCELRTGPQCAPTITRLASIIPREQPQIVAGPIPNFRIVKEECDGFNLRVTGAGSGPLLYRWYRNGVALNCALNPTACTNRLEIAIAQQGLDGGIYTCRLSSSACGSELTVESPPADVLVACVADFDDGAAGGLPDGGVNLEDLLYYLFLYEQGLRAADISTDGSSCERDGAVTIEDLLFFLERYQLGC